MGFPMTMHGGRSSNQSAFNPSQVSGLAGWWDPNDSATLTNSAGRVTQLNDKSGNGRNLTPPSTGPLVDTGTISGKTMFQADSAAARLSNAAIMSVFATSAWSVVMLTPPSGSISKRFWTAVSANSNSIYLQKSAASIIAFASSDGSQTSGLNNATDYIDTSTWDGSTLSIYEPTAGSVSGALSSGMSASGTFTVGPDGSGATYNGTPYSFGDVMVFNKVLGTAERQKLEGYLAWKWDQVASLPTGHPYKTAAP